MKLGILLLFLTVSGKCFSQHCPWDCTGFLMLRTDASYAEMKKLNPVLVDGRKNIVVDTLYGTGLPTYDSCIFMLFSDFKKYRTERIKLHPWYEYDTLLNFAEGHYVVHYNYCRYKWDQNSSLFIRYNDPEVKNSYKYMEIPPDKRIHLHDFNSAIRIEKKKNILADVEPMVILINRKEWTGK